MLRTVYKVNAFTAEGHGGNPAGVVLDADSLNDQQMQSIAIQAGFAETAFIHSHPDADRELRFFTQTNEIDLCGHATIAAWRLMHQKAQLAAGKYVQQTRAGLLGVSVTDDGQVFMEQKPATFYEEIPPSIIAPLVEIAESSFSGTLRPQIVSTGIRDLFVPVKDKAVLGQLTPHLNEITAFSQRHDISGLHFFSLLPNGLSVASARNFAPADGIDEEAATGTSNGALLCYLREKSLLAPQDRYRVEQGERMGQLSYIYGRFLNEVIWIGGTATVMAELEVDPDTVPSAIV